MKLTHTMQYSSAEMLIFGGQTDCIPAEYWVCREVARWKENGATSYAQHATHNVMVVHNGKRELDRDAIY